MKTIGVTVVLVMGAISLRIAPRLSDDALGILLGIFFMAMAPVPLMLFVLVQRHPHASPPRQAQPPQPPVIYLRDSDWLAAPTHEQRRQIAESDVWLTRR